MADFNKNMSLDFLWLGWYLTHAKTALGFLQEKKALSNERRFMKKKKVERRVRDLRK